MRWILFSLFLILLLLILLFAGRGGVILFQNLLYKSQFTELSELNQKVALKVNVEYASYNSYGFTDVNHTYKKPDSIFRIAILGDSFVWGQGVLYHETWNYRLQSLMLARYPNIEVLHWGRNGWNYKDQLLFLKSEGVKYQPNLLLVSWYMNDVFGGDTDSMEAMLPANPIEALRPHLLDKLYSPLGISEYSDSLKNLKSYLDTKGIPTVFCIVSNSPSLYRAYTDQGKQMMNEVGFPICDMDSIVTADLPNSLHRNFLFFAAPNDFHSGPLLNQLFASAAMEWLTQKGYLKGIHTQRQTVPLNIKDRWRAR